MAPVLAILRKDLRTELRTRQSVPAMSLLSTTTFVVFHFGLDRSSVEGELAAGVLWVTLLFAAMLGINRLFVAEQEEGGFDGFLLAPIDRSAMLLAKVVALLIYLVALELVALPAFALLLLGPAPTQALPELLAIIALADVGIAVVGTLVAALAVRARARELLVPLLALPLLLPVLIGAAEASAPLFLDAGAEPVKAQWYLVLGLYDMVFALLAYAVFDFLVED